MVGLGLQPSVLDTVHLIHFGYEFVDDCDYLQPENAQYLDKRETAECEEREISTLTYHRPRIQCGDPGYITGSLSPLVTFRWSVEALSIEARLRSGEVTIDTLAPELELKQVFGIC